MPEVPPPRVSSTHALTHFRTHALFSEPAGAFAGPAGILQRARQAAGQVRSAQRRVGAAHGRVARVVVLGPAFVLELARVAAAFATVHPTVVVPAVAAAEVAAVSPAPPHPAA